MIAGCGRLVRCVCRQRVVHVRGGYGGVVQGAAALSSQGARSDAR